MFRNSVLKCPKVLFLLSEIIFNFTSRISLLYIELRVKIENILVLKELSVVHGTCCQFVQRRRFA